MTDGLRFKGCPMNDTCMYLSVDALPILDVSIGSIWIHTDP